MPLKRFAFIVPLALSPWLVGGTAALADCGAVCPPVALQAPAIVVPPGSSITGSPASLRITSPTTVDPDPIDALGYPVTLHITSSNTSDWGDATAPTTTTSDGGAGYPTGDIWHVY